MTRCREGAVRPVASTRVSPARTALASTASLFLSSTFHKLAFDVPNEVKGFRLPDVSMYLTTKGPTYRVKSGYRTNGYEISVASETTLKGERAGEFSLGFKKLGWFGSPRQAAFVGFTGTNLAAWYRFFFVTVGINRYDARSLFGERHIPSLAGGDIYTETWVRLTYRY